jgi:superoxide reductase
MTTGQATGINRVNDIGNMTDLEKKHVPLIHMDGTPRAGEEFDVTIWVGEQLAHPSEAGHHIEFIDLYLDDKFIARCDLTWGNTTPKVTFTVKTESAGVLKAYERCNLHGDWTYEQELAL